MYLVGNLATHINAYEMHSCNPVTLLVGICPEETVGQVWKDENYRVLVTIVYNSKISQIVLIAVKD